MSRVRVKLVLISAVGSLFFSGYLIAQANPYSPNAILPPAPKAASVKITQGPELELVRNNWAIIRWTTNNPGGTDQHDAIVHYGTSPNDLNEVAKSPIHVNREHSDALFRVRVLGLSPHTTYYYRVDSSESNGKSDGVESPVKQFSTP